MGEFPPVRQQRGTRLRPEVLKRGRQRPRRPRRLRRRLVAKRVVGEAGELTIAFVARNRPALAPADHSWVGDAVARHASAREEAVAPSRASNRSSLDLVDHTAGDRGAGDVTSPPWSRIRSSAA